MKLFFSLLLINVFSHCLAQPEVEVAPAFNIKTIAFVQNGQNTAPFFQLGDSFYLEFDDLFGTETNYYYTINQYNYDWTPTELTKNEYIQGFDDQRIQDYTNSFNTLQIYSHYRIEFPNTLTAIKLSGNYIIKILNEDKEVVFSRKFVVYQNQVSVPIQVRRARAAIDLSTKQNLDFSIKSSKINFQDPTKNVKITICQNNNFQKIIQNIKPQYTMGNDLIYKYDAATQFWGGNEFLNFDTKDIRVPAGNIQHVDASSGIYNTHLYVTKARKFNPFTYYPDINGGYYVRKFNAENNTIEADYSWVFFYYYYPNSLENNDIYINGLFNNYALSADSKMEFNPKTGFYEKAIMIKQGFTNYQYQIANQTLEIQNQLAPEGNFYQTENNYTILVYYRENGQRYDAVIGRGDASSVDIIN